MSLKVCGTCGTPYAHSLDKCPNCAAPEFVMEHELPDNWREMWDQARDEMLANARGVMVAEPEHADVVEDSTSEDPQRPKDSASAADWKTYAKTLDPDSADAIEHMTRTDLITIYG